MEHHTLKNVNNCLIANIYSYLEKSGGQSLNPYLNVVHFSTPGLIRNLWQLKTVASCIGVYYVLFHYDSTTIGMLQPLNSLVFDKH
jgi:hypothetical protein